MFTWLFERKINKFNKCSDDSGVLLLELAISLPLVMFIGFVGYEITRRMTIDFTMKEMAREIAVASYLCSFRDDSGRDLCVDRIFEGVGIVGRSQFAQEDGESPRIEFSVETYQFDPTVNELIDTTSTVTNGRPSQFSIRTNSCSELALVDPSLGNSSLVNSSEMRFMLNVSRSTSENFQPKYSLRYRNPEEWTLLNLIPKEMHERRITTCLNNGVTIAEVQVRYRPVLGFAWNLLSRSEEDLREVSDEVLLRTVVFL